MNRAKKLLILKHFIYALLMVVLYVVQTTPGLLLVRGVKPLLVVPFAISIAMHEGEFVGGIYGAVAGLLCDTVGTSLFGFNGFFICFFCAVIGLLVIYLVRCNMLGCMMFVLITLLAVGSIEFLFAYGMWGYENVWKLYVFYTLPTVIYSLVATPICFRLLGAIFRRFDAAIHP